MLASLLLLAPPFALEVKTYRVDGVERQALVYTPTGSGRHPLVLAFHGHGGNMRFADRAFDVEGTWPEAIAIYPQGLPTPGMTDPEGVKNGWQQKEGDQEDRDLKLVDKILAETPNVDLKRVYAMGHSNGGRFTYVLWAARGDRFAAYGPSGTPGELMVRRFVPASAFCTAGEKDPIVSYRLQVRTIDAIRKLIGAEPDKAKKDGYITLEPAQDGLELGTYLHPGGHEYPREAAQATIELFKRHAKR